MGLRGLRRRTTLMPLDDTLAALGRDGVMGRQEEVVPLESVVGSASRHIDFDADFRLVNPALRRRRDGLIAMMQAGGYPEPLDLVRLGELYFVRDGHHRVAAAKSLGWGHLPAEVTRVCTIAYAMCCIRRAHLASKAAERHFLERVPLPDGVRRDLWLDEPADWARLADAAEAWAYRTGTYRTGTRRIRVGGGQSIGTPELAAAWWREEVTPVLDRLRPGVSGLRDVQLYVTALAVRDRLGSLDWPDDLAIRVGAG